MKIKRTLFKIFPCLLMLLTVFNIYCSAAVISETEELTEEYAVYLAQYRNKRVDFRKTILDGEDSFSEVSDEQRKICRANYGKYEADEMVRVYGVANWFVDQEATSFCELCDIDYYRNQYLLVLNNQVTTEEKAPAQFSLLGGDKASEPAFTSMMPVLYSYAKEPSLVFDDSEQVQRRYIVNHCTWDFVLGATAVAAVIYETADDVRVLLMTGVEEDSIYLLTWDEYLSYFEKLAGERKAKMKEHSDEVGCHQYNKDGEYIGCGCSFGEGEVAANAKAIDYTAIAPTDARRLTAPVPFAEAGTDAPNISWVFVAIPIAVCAAAAVIVPLVIKKKPRPAQPDETAE